MRGIIVMLASTIAGAVGWKLGAYAGTFTAFALSIVGTAAGVYFGRWFAREYLPY